METKFARHGDESAVILIRVHSDRSAISRVSTRYLASRADQTDPSPDVCFHTELAFLLDSGVNEDVDRLMRTCLGGVEVLDEGCNRVKLSTR